MTPEHYDTLTVDDWNVYAMALEEYFEDMKNSGE